MVAALHRRHAPVHEVMETAGLTEIANRSVAKCSGGEQQRLKFALALRPQPELIILDEANSQRGGISCALTFEGYQRGDGRQERPGRDQLVA